MVQPGAPGRNRTPYPLRFYKKGASLVEVGGESNV
jgi:hypothetical protein